MVKPIKKLFKYIAVFLLSFIGFVLLYLLTAFCLSRITVDKDKDGTNELAIYIKTNAVHTDIVMPLRNDQRDWSREIKFSNTHVKDTATIKYVAMGWGDKGFYLETPTWGDLKFSTAFKAAFALSTTAIHATFYADLVEDESCKKIMISKDQYSRLLKYIDESLQHDALGHVIYIATNANYGNTDAFYEANGSYSMFRTCNSWANTALKKCGQRACLWTAFDTGIFLKYK
ncbi:MAG: TIGR02117 family protein [Ferruginibacter sp.]